MFTATDINTIDGEIIANAVIPDAIDNTPSPILRKTWPKKMMLAIVVMTAVVSACFAFFSTDYKPLSYKNLGKVGSCNLKLVTTYHYIEHVDANLNEIGAQLASKNFNCSTPATVYYYSSKVLVGKIGKNDSMYFIAYCPQTDSKQINLQCKNLYENTHI